MSRYLTTASSIASSSPTGSPEARPIPFAYRYAIAARRSDENTYRLSPRAANTLGRGRCIGAASTACVESAVAAAAATARAIFTRRTVSVCLVSHESEPRVPHPPVAEKCW